MPGVQPRPAWFQCAFSVMHKIESEFGLNLVICIGRWSAGLYAVQQSKLLWDIWFYSSFQLAAETIFNQNQYIFRGHPYINHSDFPVAEPKIYGFGPSIWFLAAFFFDCYLNLLERIQMLSINNWSKRWLDTVIKSMLLSYWPGIWFAQASYGFESGAISHMWYWRLTANRGIDEVSGYTSN